MLMVVATGAAGDDADDGGGEVVCVCVCCQCLKSVTPDLSAASARRAQGRAAGFEAAVLAVLRTS